MATFLLYAYPAMVFLMARLALDERWTRIKFSGLVTSLIGVAFLSGLLGGAEWKPMGMVIGLLAPLSIAYATILGKQAVGRIHPTTMMTYGSVLAAFLLFPVALVFSGGVASLALPNATSALWVLGMGLLPGLAAPTLLMWSLRWLDAGTASVMLVLEPVVAMLIGWMVFNEGLTSSQWVGAALILASAVLVKRARWPTRWSGSPVWEFTSRPFRRPIPRPEDDATGITEIMAP